ncbi:hypothetical protein [Nocardia sp. NPDC050175]|uniref:hypothetical protein n=1 Tax=Nocardia sp. NPDC050175 TaxID=3364317 RepID=UPI0037B16A0C
MWFLAGLASWVWHFLETVDKPDLVVGSLLPAAADQEARGLRLTDRSGSLGMIDGCCPVFARSERSCSEESVVTTMPEVRFDTLWELEVAFRAMATFKFSGSEDADIFMGSPIMASALEKMLSAIADGWDQEGYAGKATNWRDWYALSSAGERQVERISAYLPQHPEWESMSRVERFEWLRIVAAPYRLDDGGIARLESVIGPAEVQ